jgi:hypothetical protein
MKLKLFTATAIFAMAASGALASPSVASCPPAGWVVLSTTPDSESDPETSSVCYTGGSGNEVNCARNGNLVSVNITTIMVTPGSTTYEPPEGRSGQTCTVGGGDPYEVVTDCNISRTRETGSTAFDYCEAYE